MGKSIVERVEAMEKEPQEIKEQLAKKQIHKDIKVGDNFDVAGISWKVLEITEKGYHCLANDRVAERKQFDSKCNDWKESSLRKWLNDEIYNLLAEEVGEEAIVPFERDLLSLDGQTEYGNCEDKVSLLTVDEYRRYRKMIPNVQYWWWLCTPWSTKCNEDTVWVTVVSPSGDIDNYDYDICIGFRPFCIFSSSLFESEDE